MLEYTKLQLSPGDQRFSVLCSTDSSFWWLCVEMNSITHVISCFKASVDSLQEGEDSTFFWCPIYPHTLGCLKEDKASLIGSS